MSLAEAGMITVVSMFFLSWQHYGEHYFYSKKFLRR